MKFTRVTEILIGAPLVLAGCSDANLYKGPVNADATSAISFCTTPSAQIVTNLKYLFVQDLSGSNQQNFTTTSATDNNPQPDPAGGTDPTGVRRYPPLISFLQNSAANANTFYAGITYGTQPTVPFGGYGGTQEDTQNDSIWYSNGSPNTATQMANNYSLMYNNGQPQGDGGWTDYIDTLILVQNSIQADINYQQTLVAQGQPLVASDYVIFWVSDGFPYVANGAQSSATILQLVQNIMNLKTQYPLYISNITFNTGFYTTITASYEQAQAESLMTSMAQVGQGAFVNFSTTQIDYSKFTVPQRNQSYTLRDFWIQDASEVWWNGQLMLDSDGDGLPDSVEVTLGSDPFTYDSDHNGVGDGIEYFLWGQPCGSSTCSVAGAKNNFLAVSGCATPGAYPNVYRDTDSDYLNDCEEGLLGSSFIAFDSNQDWVPDEFEWVNNVPFVSGTNALNADPENDGYTDYFKLKQNLPINFPVNQIQYVNPMSYQLVQTSTNSSQTCYNVNVQNIPIMSTHDVMRAYIMESTQTGLPHMRVLKNLTHMNGSGISLTDSDFTP